jgi:hypothetical protein
MWQVFSVENNYNPIFSILALDLLDSAVKSNSRHSAIQGYM